MKIEGNQISFKSDPQFFLLELRGDKPNTVRQIKGKELELFKAAQHNLSLIIIINKDTGDYFLRELTNISSVTFSGMDLWIFSWRATL